MVEGVYPSAPLQLPFQSDLMLAVLLLYLHLGLQLDEGHLAEQDGHSPFLPTRGRVRGGDVWEEISLLRPQRKGMVQLHREEKWEKRAPGEEEEVIRPS